MVSRMNILLENYFNIIHIEALTALDIATKEIAPSIIKYQNFLLEEINNKTKIQESASKNEKHAKLSSALEMRLLEKISSLSEKFNDSLIALEKGLNTYSKIKTDLEKARHCKNVLLKDMDDLRTYADEIELHMAKEFHPFPTYEDILYSVKY